MGEAAASAGGDGGGTVAEGAGVAESKGVAGCSVGGAVVARISEADAAVADRMTSAIAMLCSVGVVVRLAKLSCVRTAAIPTAAATMTRATTATRMSFFMLRRDGSMHHCSVIGLKGIVKMKREPTPISLSIHILPRCASTSALAIARPTPVSPTPCIRGLSARYSRVNTRF